MSSPTPGARVGTARFELATPCSQSRCATRLRHVPGRVVRRQCTPCPRPRCLTGSLPGWYGRAVQVRRLLLVAVSAAALLGATPGSAGAASTFATEQVWQAG